jgi:hypothetical protein
MQYQSLALTEDQVVIAQNFICLMLVDNKVKLNPDDLKIGKYVFICSNYENEFELIKPDLVRLAEVLKRCGLGVKTPESNKISLSFKEMERLSNKAEEFLTELQKIKNRIKSWSLWTEFKVFLWSWIPFVIHDVPLPFWGIVRSTRLDELKSFINKILEGLNASFDEREIFICFANDVCSGFRQQYFQLRNLFERYTKISMLSFDNLLSIPLAVHTERVSKIMDQKNREFLTSCMMDISRSPLGRHKDYIKRMLGVDPRTNNDSVPIAKIDAKIIEDEVEFQLEKEKYFKLTFELPPVLMVSEKDNNEANRNMIIKRIDEIFSIFSSESGKTIGMIPDGNKRSCVVSLTDEAATAFQQMIDKLYPLPPLNTDDSFSLQVVATIKSQPV